MIIENKNIGITSEDVTQCEDLNKLEEWRIAVLEDIMGMKSQIDAAKSNAWAKGDYSDPDWFRSVRIAKRCQNLLKEQIIKRIRELKGYPKETRQKSLAEFFLEVAEENLSEDKFIEIKMKAYYRIKKTKQ